VTLGSLDGFFVEASFFFLSPMPLLIDDTFFITTSFPTTKPPKPGDLLLPLTPVPTIPSQRVPSFVLLRGVGWDCFGLLLQFFPLFVSSFPSDFFLLSSLTQPVFMRPSDIPLHFPLPAMIR